MFVETGPWLRALYYPSAGEEPQDAVNREVANVRDQVGICDVSTLGKIDVQGSDAGIFLDRVYANTFSTLPVGKARYGLMLREDGFVLDDGTTARLREDHYFMTTTTVNAVKVMQHLEFCQQCLWPELDVRDGVGHRAMGAVRRRRSSSARGAAKRRRSRRTTSRTRRSPILPSAR